MGVDVVGDLADLVPAGRRASDPATDAYAVPSDATLLAESVATIADLLVVLNERRAAVQQADDLTTTAQEKPVRFALVQAAENRPVLRKLRGAYRAAKARRRGELAESPGSRRQIVGPIDRRGTGPIGPVGVHQRDHWDA